MSKVLSVSAVEVIELNSPCLHIKAWPQLHHDREKSMKKRILTLANNELFQILMYGVFAYIGFTATIIATLQVPPEAILDSGLKEILMIFEG
jgi:hypothetical protein